MTETRITISCSTSTSDDELICSYGDPRIKVDEFGAWFLELEEDESIVFVLQDLEDSDVQYTLNAKSSKDGGGWIPWEAAEDGLQSPSFPAPARVEIEIEAVPPGQTQAKKSTSIGTISGHGRQDPTLDA